MEKNDDWFNVWCEPSYCLSICKSGHPINVLITGKARYVKRIVFFSRGLYIARGDKENNHITLDAHFIIFALKILFILL